MAGTAEERFLFDVERSAARRNSIMGFLNILIETSQQPEAKAIASLAQMTIDLITELEELINDDERSMLPSAMRVCVTDEALFLLSDTPDGKCPICGVLLTNVEVYEGPADEEGEDDDEG